MKIRLSFRNIKMWLIKTAFFKFIRYRTYWNVILLSFYNAIKFFIILFSPLIYWLTQLLKLSSDGGPLRLLYAYNTYVQCPYLKGGVHQFPSRVTGRDIGTKRSKKDHFGPLCRVHLSSHDRVMKLSQGHYLLVFLWSSHRD